MKRPVSTSRFERKLRTILGASGSTMLEGVEDHVSGLIVLESERPEWLLSGGEQMGWGRETRAALAANVSYTALINPANSGVVAVLEAYLNVSAAVDFFLLYTATTAAALPGFGGGGTGRARDMRNTNSALACSTAFGVIVPPVPADGPAWVVPAGLIYEARNQGYFVLGPGSALLATTTIVAAIATGVWHWREVPLEAGKLG